MGKRRKLAHQGPGTKDSSQHATKKAALSSKPRSKPFSSTTPPKASPQQQHQAPTIPFEPYDRILLVGEGDLSFAASLIEHHGCADLTATVFEADLEELTTKYPHVTENVTKITEGDGKVLYAIDARRMTPFTERDKKNKGSGSDRTGIMDRIIFNFPHVGGKSTDVNRQVRYNQELLVSFFKQAIPSLAPGGSIIVTLFEGEPYTLWNIRDLGRHSGLQVQRSFRFDASAYPGYHHARTLGVVKNRHGEVSGSSWKGEDRAARSYVFIRKDDGVAIAKRPSNGAGKKRQRGGDDESSEDD
jgi:25S rRNA (uracil2634-N3)-methyltransferase